jgi:hypothetical protein
MHLDVEAHLTPRDEAGGHALWPAFRATWRDDRLVSDTNRQDCDTVARRALRDASRDRQRHVTIVRADVRILLLPRPCVSAVFSIVSTHESIAEREGGEMDRYTKAVLTVIAVLLAWIATCLTQAPMAMAARPADNQVGTNVNIAAVGGIPIDVSLCSACGDKIKAIPTAAPSSIKK